MNTDEFIAPIPLTPIQASYRAPREQLIRAVGQVLPYLPRSDGRSWELDGHTSTALRLHIPSDPLAVINVQIRLHDGDATLWCATSSPSVQEWYARFFALLDGHLPRRTR